MTLIDHCHEYTFCVNINVPGHISIFGIGTINVINEINTSEKTRQ